MIGFKNTKFSDVFPYVFAAGAISAVAIPMIIGVTSKSQSINICRGGKAAAIQINGIVQQAGNGLFLKNAERTSLLMQAGKSCGSSPKCSTLLQNVGKPVSAVYCEGQIISFTVADKTFENDAWPGF